MRVFGKIISRCPTCRNKGLSGFKKCNHKDRRYVLDIRVDGKPIRRTAGYNKADAQKLLAETISKIHNGEYFKPKDKTFKEFTEIWLEDYAKKRIRERTFKTYQGTIRNHLNPYFGKMRMGEITEEKVQRFITKLLEIRSVKTANNTLKQLKTILRIAKRWKYIQYNPAWDIENIPEEHKEMDYLTPEEVRLLLKHAREPFRTLLLVAIFTGMRRSEILALQWGDVDWNSNTVFVRRSIYWKSRKDIEKEDVRWRFVAPKSKRSHRAIFMSPTLKKALEIHRIKARANENDLVFCNSEGNPVDPDNMMKRDFLPTLSFAGLRKIRFHDFRHTFTALLIDMRENVKFIQGQLGHASAQTTLDRYGHLLPVDNVVVGNKMDEKVFGEKVKLEPCFK